MSAEIDQRIDEHRCLGESVCEALRKEVFKMGFPINFIIPDINDADFSLSKDPANGEDSLLGIWRDENGQKKGEILFHADGSFFAEYDVISEHPEKSRWFVEAVIAWGRENTIKCEPKLLPFAED